MRIKLLRYILALFLCGTTTAAMAAEKSDTLLSEDFSEFSIPQGWTDNKSKLVNNNWEVFYCNTKIGQVERQALVLQKDKNAYAITPATGYDGDVTLSFLYAKTASDSNTCTLQLSTINGGTIDGDNTLSFTNKYTNSYNQATIKIRNATKNTKIKIYLETSSVQAIVDDVVITRDYIALDQDADNNELINGKDERTITVKTSRTLTGDIWNTMCLPFDMTKATLAEAWETSVELRTYSGYSNNTMSFSSAESVTAGTPFLIKVGKTITNPTFESVTISNAADTIINHDGVKFIGTYSGRDLNTDGTHLFITTTGTVAKPLDDSHNHLKGLRAYIDLTDCPSPVRLNIDGETTDIQQVAIDEERPDALYDLKGQRLQSPKKGIIIKDGKLSFIK